ncbi:unnamed protein product [Pylaiella littoralis]
MGCSEVSTDLRMKRPPRLLAAPAASASATATPLRQKRTCTAVTALAAIVLANLSAFSQAFSPSVVTGTAAAAAQSRDGMGTPVCKSGFTAPARMPRRWVPQQQQQHHHEAAGFAAMVLPSSRACLMSNGGSGSKGSIRGSPRRLSPTRRKGSSMDNVMMVGSNNSNTSNNQQQPQQPQPQLQLLQGTVLLQPGDPIEFWHAQGLVLGNYENPVAGRQSLAVRTETGEKLTIDVGQIVGVWRGDEMSGSLPQPQRNGSSGNANTGSVAVVAAWAEVREEARVLLQSTPARGLDLGAFWRAASSKGKGFLVTPAHAAEFLFGAGSPAKLGLRKRPLFQFRGAGESFRPTAVERAAAAQVLAGERSRFKRVVSKRLGGAGGSSSGGSSKAETKKRISNEEDAVRRGPGNDDADSAVGVAGGAQEEERQAQEQQQQQQQQQQEEQPALISVGGFKAVDQSVAVTREVAGFCQVVKGVKRAAAAVAAGVAAGYGGAAAGMEEEGAGSALARAGLFEPAFLLILHSLEAICIDSLFPLMLQAFAIGGDEQSLNPEARRVMMELVGKASPKAAESILVDVGLWTSRKQKQQRRAEEGPEEVKANGSTDSNDENGGGEEAGGAAGDDGGVVPWSTEALQAAAALGKERAKRAANYGKREPQGKVGAPAPFGRFDFRGASFGVYCIDGAGTNFLDDAFSVDPDTREVFIHITDVQGLVPAGSTLDDVARLRAASEYLPQGPLFMMPPTALKSMSFSDKAVNEAVTVGIRLDPKTGGVTSSRVMLTLLPPVIPLTTDQADRVLEATEKGETGEGRLARVAKEIQALEYVGRRSAEASGRRERGREGVKFRKGPGGEAQAVEVAMSRAGSLIDELLTVYTQEAYRLCKKAGVAMPSLVGQQDRVANGRSRYGTGPLRRYIDILAQRQMVAILRGTGYLNKQDLIETASYLTWRQNKTRASRNEEAGRLSLEALAAHCLTQTKATGLKHAVVPARGTGQGRQVRLEGLGGGVQVHAKRPPGRRGVAIKKGQAVRVVIERVEPRLKQVVATEFFDDAEEAVAGAGAGTAGNGGSRG